jgi:hypothetical protein
VTAGIPPGHNGNAVAFRALHSSSPMTFQSPT